MSHYPIERCELVSELYEREGKEGIVKAFFIHSGITFDEYLSEIISHDWHELYLDAYMRQEHIEAMVQANAHRILTKVLNKNPGWVNSVTKEHRTHVINLALRKGNEECASLIYENPLFDMKHRDVRSKDLDMFIMACTSGNQRCITFAHHLTNGAQVSDRKMGTTPAMIACLNGDVFLWDLISETAGFTLNEKPPLPPHHMNVVEVMVTHPIWTVSTDYAVMLRRLFLHPACRSTIIETMSVKRSLIRHGLKRKRNKQPPDTTTITMTVTTNRYPAPTENKIPLILKACLHGNHHVLKEVIHSGFVTDLVYTRDDHQRGVVWYSVYGESPECLSLLLKDDNMIKRERIDPYPLEENFTEVENTSLWMAMIVSKSNNSTTMSNHHHNSKSLLDMLLGGFEASESMRKMVARVAEHCRKSNNNSDAAKKIFLTLEKKFASLPPL